MILYLNKERIPAQFTFPVKVTYREAAFLLYRDLSAENSTTYAEKREFEVRVQSHSMCCLVICD